MRTTTVRDMDHLTDKIVALFALAAGLGGVMAEDWPVAAVALFIALTVGLVVVIVASERAKESDAIVDRCDSDQHPADVARDLEHQQ